MLTRILDTEAIDTENEIIQHELETDLKRIDSMDFKNAPKEANAYKVIVKPSLVTYFEEFHRFIFEIQYGTLEKGEFSQIGESIKTQSELLPLSYNYNNK
ncbi:MAG: hypothetical protein ACW98D_19380 [Promethearchaeota archaeon]|jgi:hypothetical protein